MGRASLLHRRSAGEYADLFGTFVGFQERTLSIGNFCDVGIIVMVRGSYLKTGPGLRLRVSTASPPGDLPVSTPYCDRWLTGCAEL